MKKRVLTFLCLLSGLMAGAVDTLQPESCNLGHRPFTAPLSFAYFTFDGGIKLMDGATATVECDGKTVATAVKLEISNYRGVKRTQGTLTALFEEMLLPKGQTYKLCIPSGTISKEDDDEIMNSDITQTFSVPENLGPGRFDVADGVIITKTSRYAGGLYPCFWGIETEAVGDPSFILYREGIAIREFPAYVTWDWDLGQAYPEIEEEMRFEKGVNYSLVLPAGSVHAMHRDDIVNEDVALNFIGGYEETIPPLQYSWCSLFSNHSDILYEITFSYDRPVRVSENAVIQLWYADGSEMVKEAAAYINTDINCWAVSANFDGYEMTSERGYTFIIPEGTVISENGDPLVNPYCSVPIAGGSGINNLYEGPDDYSSVTYDLNGHRTTTPIVGKMYVRNGQKFIYK